MGAIECVITDPPTHFDTGLVVGEVVWDLPDGGEVVPPPSHPINIHVVLGKNPARRGERQSVDFYVLPPDYLYASEWEVFYPGEEAFWFRFLGDGGSWPIDERAAPGLVTIHFTVYREYLYGYKPCPPCGYYNATRVWRMAVGFNIQ